MGEFGDEGGDCIDVFLLGLLVLGVDQGDYVLEGGLGLDDFHNGGVLVLEVEGDSEFAKEQVEVALGVD